MLTSENERKVFIHIYMNSRLSNTCLLDLFLSLSLLLFLIPILLLPFSIRVYILPSFFSLYACERTHILHYSVFLFVLMIYDGRRGKKLYVCVFTTPRYETKTDIRKEMGRLSLSLFFMFFLNSLSRAYKKR